MIIFKDINWGSVENFIYFPIVISIVAILLFKFFKSKKIVALLLPKKFIKQFLLRYSNTKNIIKTVLLAIATLFLFLSLLSPQWNEKEEKIEQEGRDLFIALDISRSMLAEDMKPDRLAFAKEKIKSLLSLLSAERVGLILFSGATFVQCPLTTDYASFFAFLEQIDVETISSGTTAIDQAIKQALDAFKIAGRKKSKLLVVFTDGEDFSSNLRGVREEAAKEGLTIFTVGVGTQVGAPIPLFNDHGRQIGHQKDRKGEVVISRLNEAILSNLARDTGGIYIHAEPKSNLDMKKIISAIQKFEKDKFEDKKVKILEEQYPYFIFVTFIALLIEWLL